MIENVVVRFDYDDSFDYDYDDDRFGASFDDAMVISSQLFDVDEDFDGDLFNAFTFSLVIRNINGCGYRIC